MTLTYSSTTSVEPTVEPITLAEAKRNCDIDDNHRDADFRRWIKAARQKVEHDCRRALITQTRVMKFNEWPSSGTCFELLDPPLQSVSSITYLDTDGNSQTWSSSNYEVDIARTPGTVWQAYNVMWPTIRAIQNAITVTYVAGYGAGATNVPAAARDAMMLLIKNRLDVNSPLLIGSISKELELSYSSLIHELYWGSYP